MYNKLIRKKKTQFYKKFRAPAVKTRTIFSLLTWPKRFYRYSTSIFGIFCIAYFKDQFENQLSLIIISKITFLLTIHCNQIFRKNVFTKAFDYYRFKGVESGWWNSKVDLRAIIRQIDTNIDSSGYYSLWDLGFHRDGQTVGENIYKIYKCLWNWIQWWIKWFIAFRTLDVKLRHFVAQEEAPMGGT